MTDPRPDSSPEPVRRNILLKVFGGLVAVVLCAAFLLGWRILSGPVSLDFAADLIRDSLVPDTSSVTVRTGTPVLTWHGLDALFDITVPDVRVTGTGPDFEVFAPDLRLLLSPAALVRGEIRPVRVSFDRPGIRITPGDEEDAPGPLALLAFIDTFRSGPGRALPVIEIRGGSLETRDMLLGPVLLTDLAAAVRETGADRDLEIRVTTRARVADQEIVLAADAARSSWSRITKGTVRARTVDPRLLARLLSAPQYRRVVSTPVDIEIDFELEPDLALRSASGSLESRNGLIEPPGLDIEPVAFDRVHLLGQYDRLARVVRLDELKVEGQPWSIAVSGTVRDIDTTASAALTARVRTLPTADIARFWPPNLASNARSWVDRNLEDGQVSGADFTLEADLAPSAAVRLRRLDGTAEFSGVTVHYLRPLEPARGARGRATIGLDSMIFDVSAAQVDTLTVAGGQAQLADLHGDLPTADIELRVQGPLARAMEILDSSRLRLASRAGVDPAGVEGTGEAEITLGFPLLQALRLEQIDYAVTARLGDVTLPDVTLGRPLTDGSLRLSLDHSGLQVEGTGSLEGQPIELAVTDRLDRSAPVSRHIRLSGQVPGSVLHEQGWPYEIGIEGDAAVQAEVTERAGGTTVVKALFDMRRARVSIPDIDVFKPAETPGRLEMVLTLDGDRLTGIDSGIIEMPSLSSDFEVALDARTGRTRRIDLHRAELVDSDLRGVIEARDDGTWHASVSGARLNAGRFLNGADPSGRGPPFTAEARFDQVTLPDLPPVDNTHVTMRHDGVRVVNAQLTGQIDGTALNAVYEQIPGGALIRGESDDAGRLLASMRHTSSVRGGTLHASGRIVGDDADRRTDLQITIDGFRVIEAPLLGHILSAASLTGLMDLLLGKGIQFERLTATVQREGPILRITDSLAYGPSLGVSAVGTINRETGIADLEGMIVPAYGLSRLIDRIPLLGRILTGGEGEGLLAAEYFLDGHVDDPRVAINPLTALAPGFLRSLVSMTGAEPTGERPAEAGTETDQR